MTLPPISKQPIALAAIACGYLATAACIERVTFKPYVPPEAPPVPLLRSPRNNAYIDPTHKGFVTSVFQWTPVQNSGPENIIYELEYSEDSTFDPEKTTRILTTSSTHTPPMPLPVSIAPPVGTRYHWRARACIEDACSEWSDIWRFNLGRKKRDINGDGLSDLVITSQGKLQIFLGGNGTVFDTIPDSQFPRTNIRSYESIAHAGDLNGDGFGDIVVETRNSDSGSVDTVVLLGNPGPFLDQTPDLRLGSRFGFSGGGDLNGDGYDDLAMPGNGETAGTLELFYGRATILPTDSTEKLGATTGMPHIIGDVDGDGIDDLAIAYSDHVRIHLGTPTTLSIAQANSIISVATTDVIDSPSLCTAGDINGDGTDDIVIGTPRSSIVGRDTGRATVYLGSRGRPIDNSPDLSITGTVPDAVFGYKVFGIGDINSDGFHDIAVSSRGSPPALLRGRVDIYLGSKTETLDNTTDANISGESDGDLFGDGLTMGRFNEDSYDDIAIAARLNDSGWFNAGRVYVFLGQPGTSLDATADGVVTGTSTNELLGNVAY